MIEKVELTEIYVRQYELAGKRRRGAAVKAKGASERTVSLAKVLKRTKNSQVTKNALENYHRQINNLYYCAVRYGIRQVLERLRRDVIPELVRLDLAILLPEDERLVGPAFFQYLETDAAGEICVVPLYDLFRVFRTEALMNKILQLVPSRPELEFPEALEMKRHFILHIGPTNRGKTFQALERLKKAESGVYLGPLRLLALEVFEKMNEYGVPCTMLTGQECIARENSRVTASTVEMADFYKDYDIAVIDEAQMAADPERGHCWTKAVLGIRAREIHVCMSPAAEQVIRHLIQVCGDDFEICRYERKTALLCEDTAFRFPEDVQEGDALVVFSKKSVLDVAGRLEEKGMEASVIYGSLPPEIRRRQMQLFAGGQTKVVVATDAIGMGLNLPVRRIVFIQTEKFDGIERRGLSVPEILQIAGRAGRYGLYDTGYVNAMGSAALAYIKERFAAEDKPVEKVSLGFPQVLLELDEPLDVILQVWHSQKAQAPFEKVSIDELLCLYGYAKRFQDRIMGFEDKAALYRMISCPIDVKDQKVVKQWLEYCMNYPADVSLDRPKMDTPYGKISGRRLGSRAALAKGDSRPEGTDVSESREAKKSMQSYETYYKKLDLYYQFSYRFDKVIDQEWLTKERERTEAMIMRYLSKGKKGYIARCQYCGRMLPVGYSAGKCRRCFDRKG